MSDYLDCVKSVQIRNCFWFVFSHIRTKYGREKTPYLEHFSHSVSCGRLFYEQIHSQHKLNLYYPNYSCEHVPILKRAITCFPEICYVMRFKTEKVPSLPFTLVKVKVSLQSFLLHLLRSVYFVICCNLLIMVLIAIVSFTLSSNKLGNIFNCDTNLLLPLSWQLLSNKKVLSWNCLAATNNNFWCRQKLKMWISGSLFEQKRFSFDNLTHVVFRTKGELFYKNPFQEFSPQTKTLEPPKSGREKLTFSRFTQKPLQIHNRTKNGLNTLYTYC